MKKMLVIGAGASSIAEIADARERDRWDLARDLLVGWEGRGCLAQALAREDGWAVLVPFSWPLADAIDACPACLMWDDAREAREGGAVRERCVRPEGCSPQLQLTDSSRTAERMSS